MAQLMASADARNGSVIHDATATPTRDATRLPPTIDQGWANGLAGTANRRTAEAPIGAIITGRADASPIAAQLSSPVARMQLRAPPGARSRSRRLRADNSGPRLRSTRRIAETSP